VSERISSAYEELNLPALPSAETPLEHLMDLGDALREHHDDGAVAAAITVSAISEQRFQDLGEQTDSTERDSIATIVRQLKHPDEVDLLRSVYGPRFVLLGAWSPRDERVSATEQRLRTTVLNKEPEWYAQQVERLVARDENDESLALGQRVRDTFELADAYVSLRAGHSIKDEVARVIRLLFGSPFETPTKDEQAMFQAFGARLRSSDAGRQVGAVVVDELGELLVGGTNDVPKACGGQYWTGDKPDHREFQAEADFSAQEKLRVVADLVDRLSKADGWLTDEMLQLNSAELVAKALAPDGPLRKSRVSDLLEFGRILHAEMAVICTAARRGTALGGTTMYTTTYPCHECARLIIGSGIMRVVYVDPYPKSQVPRMYRTEIGEGPPDPEGKVAFVPFAGIAPRLYPFVFAMTGRSRDPVTGKYAPWIEASAVPRLIDASVLRYPIQIAEDAVIRGLEAGYTASAAEPAGDQ
jgi:cytidine deaminase